jgi:hypothetical protein
VADILLEQAIYTNHDAGGYRFVARSPGFREDWLALAERLCTGFGERPPGIACPHCIFAQPFGWRHVAIVQVADRGADDAGRPGALGFHLLVLSHAHYLDLDGDLFAIAEQFPPSWQERGDLPTLRWEKGPLPRRTVEQVQAVLQSSDSPVLLGGAQALVDGGRLIFERPAPDTALLRRLWTVLPTHTRAELWPASFAFGNALGFHVLAMARPGDDVVDYLSEEQAAEYPEGRYELGVQAAAEAGDQAELDALFARRSAAETWRLGLVLLAVLAVLLATMGWLRLAPPPEQPPPPPAPAPRLDLPDARQYPRLSERERKQLTDDLWALARELGAEPLPSASIEQLLAAIDDRLGLPHAQRDPGPLAGYGPPKRQLQALLWKHAVPEYHDERLNSCELIERLRQKVRGGPRE